MSTTDKQDTYRSIQRSDKEVLVFKDTGKMADFAVKQWKKLADEAIKDRGRFTVALSGGTTPVLLYQKLARRKSFPWDKTFIFIVDERFVPYESDENNYHMISRTLLCHVQIPAKNIFPISTLEDTPQAAAIMYEKKILSYFRKTDGETPAFDIILLGIGDDGHTASLFPESDALNESRHLTAALSPSDRSKKERITLTYPVLNNGKNVIFFAAGKNKSTTVKQVIENTNSCLPAANVMPHNGRLVFLLDEDAGSQLS